MNVLRVCFPSRSNTGSHESYSNVARRTVRSSVFSSFRNFPECPFLDTMSSSRNGIGSFADFAERLYTFMLAFVAVDLQKGDRVVIMAPNCADHVLFDTACMVFGAVTIALPPNPRLTLLRHVVRSLQPAMILASPSDASLVLSVLSRCQCRPPAVVLTGVPSVESVAQDPDYFRKNHAVVDRDGRAVRLSHVLQLDTGMGWASDGVADAGSDPDSIVVEIPEDEGASFSGADSFAFPSHTRYVAASVTEDGAGFKDSWFDSIDSEDSDSFSADAPPVATDTVMLASVAQMLSVGATLLGRMPATPEELMRAPFSEQEALLGLPSLAPVDPATVVFDVTHQQGTLEGIEFSHGALMCAVSYIRCRVFSCVGAPLYPDTTIPPTGHVTAHTPIEQSFHTRCKTRQDVVYLPLPLNIGASRIIVQTAIQTGDCVLLSEAVMDPAIAIRATSRATVLYTPISAVENVFISQAESDGLTAGKGIFGCCKGRHKPAFSSVRVVVTTLSPGSPTPTQATMTDLARLTGARVVTFLGPPETMGLSLCLGPMTGKEVTCFPTHETSYIRLQQVSQSMGGTPGGDLSVAGPLMFTRYINRVPPDNYRLIGTHMPMYRTAQLINGSRGLALLGQSFVPVRLGNAAVSLTRIISTLGEIPGLSQSETFAGPTAVVIIFTAAGDEDPRPVIDEIQRRTGVPKDLFHFVPVSELAPCWREKYSRRAMVCEMFADHVP
ncbi:AMP-binding enzyme [Carpediemonas membranifera]|uniref:AMP-binding enzyme n=1 Tax=Carpediemonas membranifera TaxID=201153 RepID=A0A8J6B0L1_9EUKA|nr:AMP-binding enzyme [Carpediemonas membranifera]|eukprot:KAG9392973.1 AMP-binding enzyme [Carpediemonas membranifera]